VRGFFAPYLDRPFALFVLLSFLVLLIFMQHFTALPLDMAAHGLSRATLGVVLALNGILIVLIQPFVAPWLSRFNRSHVIACGACWSGLGFGLNAIARGAPMFTLGVIVWTLGEIAVLPIANAIVADVALPRDARALPGRIRHHVRARVVRGAADRDHGAPAAAGRRPLWWGCLAMGLVVAAGQLALAPALTRLRQERSGVR
jgi:MFS family permease